MPTYKPRDMKKILYLRKAAFDLIELFQTNEHAMTTQGVFQNHGKKRQISDAYHKIINGKKVNSLAETDIHCYTGLLKKILSELRALKQPVINMPTSIIMQYNTENNQGNLDEDSNWIKRLPPFNYQMICKLHTLMNTISAHSKTNHMNFRTISQVFSPDLFMHNPDIESLTCRLGKVETGDIIIEKFIQNPPPHPLESAYFTQIIHNIEHEIQTKTWDTGFAGGVRIDIAGQYKIVPQHVAEIYRIIHCKELVAEEKYTQIKELASNAIIQPQLWQKNDSFEFYSKVTNDEYTS